MKDARRFQERDVATAGLSEVNSPLMTDGSSSNRATSFAVRGRFAGSFSIIRISRSASAGGTS